MKLVCGLGNPGAKYAGTRHNAGFAICDRLAQKLGTVFSQKRFSSFFAEGRMNAEKIVLLKPQTYMNRSGDALSPAIGFYKISPAQLLVIHDDADLPPGRIRMKSGGGVAGHKGLESIRERLAADDFDRLRYGVGRPENPAFDLADFVLAPVPKEEREIHRRRFEQAAEDAMMWLTDGIDAAMNEYNGQE